MINMTQSSIDEGIIPVVLGLLVAYELFKQIASNIEQMKIWNAIKQALAICCVGTIFVGTVIGLMAVVQLVRPAENSDVQEIPAIQLPSPVIKDRSLPSSEPNDPRKGDD